MTTLTKREIAADVLATLFRNRSRIAIAEALEAGAAHGVSRRTMQRASHALGVREIHNGREGAFWEVA